MDLTKRTRTFSDIMAELGKFFIMNLTLDTKTKELLVYHGSESRGIDIGPYLSHMCLQDKLGIREYVNLLYKSEEFANESALLSMFYCSNTWYSTHRTFLIVLCSYVKDKEGTYKDVLKILNNGVDVGRIPDLYMGEGKMSIDMVCKLFGLTRDANRWMDCPRVWDLQEDKVVNNPNIPNPPGFYYEIAAITHRWEHNEITYKDLMRIEQTNTILKELDRDPKSVQISSMSPKLAKIREELKGTVRYVWMDTLCIDKTSSVELDMSIRSMHRWYSCATFVYLEHYTDFDEWRKRGWTLQEGHAAESLRVSPKHGNSFMELVSRLDDRGVSNLALNKVSKRTSSVYWFYLMRSREATIEEDKVYALIGLLDIDFQIAYGEGNKATYRMYGEIAKQKGDVSWLANRFPDTYDISPVILNPQDIQVSSLGITVKAVCLSGEDTDEGRGVVNSYGGSDKWIVNKKGPGYWIPAHKMHVHMGFGSVEAAHFYDFKGKLDNSPTSNVTIKYRH